MHPSLGARIFAVALITGTALFTLWPYDSEIDLAHMAGASEDNGIKKVDVRVDRKTIYLTVHLSRPINCSQVIKSLGIETLPVQERVFVPECRMISSGMVQILYQEAQKL